MSKYSCKCPAPGCDFYLEAEASNKESAFKKMYAKSNEHMLDKHPDFPEYEDRVAKAREYAMGNMKRK